MFEFLGTEEWSGGVQAITAVGGLVALGVAARTYTLNSRSKREAQPRLVYCRLKSTTELSEGDELDFPETEPFYAATTVSWDRSDSTMLENCVLTTVEVSNLSEEIVGPLWVRLAYTAEEWKRAPGISLAVLPPKTTVEVHLLGANEAPIGRYTMVPVLTFRDSVGRWWERRSYLPIRQLRIGPRLTDKSDAHSEPGLIRIRLGNGLAHSFLSRRARWFVEGILPRLPGIGPALSNRVREHWEQRVEDRLMKEYLREHGE